MSSRKRGCEVEGVDVAPEDSNGTCLSRGRSELSRRSGTLRQQPAFREMN